MTWQQYGSDLAWPSQMAIFALMCLTFFDPSQSVKNTNRSPQGVLLYLFFIKDGVY